MNLDSESWSCRSCGGDFIGGKPASLTCRDCTGPADMLLTALADARNRRDQADQDIRLLLAYAREVITPRPCKLADLAAAAGMSISGVRTARTTADVEHVTALLAASRAAHQHGTPAA